MHCKILTALFLGTLIACGDQSVSPSAESPLVLNSNCSQSTPDTTLLQAIENQDLVTLKAALGRCATTDLSQYPGRNDSLLNNILSYGELTSLQGNDSLVIYLLENGADSLGRHFETGLSQTRGLLATSVSSGQYTLTHYLLAHGYAVHPSAVWYAMLHNRKGLYDSLIVYIPVIDSIKENSESALGGICRNVDALPKMEPYFYDLLSRGATPDLTVSVYTEGTCPGNPTVAMTSTPLGACVFRSDSSAIRERMVRALIQAGADPYARYCTFGHDEGYTTPYMQAHIYNTSMGSLLDSLLGIPTETAPSP